jgi:hypothetical protein
MRERARAIERERTNESERTRASERERAIERENSRLFSVIQSAIKLCGATFLWTDARRDTHREKEFGGLVKTLNLISNPVTL